MSMRLLSYVDRHLNRLCLSVRRALERQPSVLLSLLTNVGTGCRSNVIVDLDHNEAERDALIADQNGAMRG
jgi:hypothetical protein